MSTARMPSDEEWAVLQSGLRLVIGSKVRESSTVDDLVQEVLARTLEALRDGRIDDPGKLAAYARGVARHVIADHYRVRRRRGETGRLTHPPARIRDPLASIISDQEIARAADALRRLSPADRRVLTLAYGDGLSSARIAERLGEPGPRVRKRKQRALERLRAEFGARPSLESSRQLGSKNAPRSQPQSSPDAEGRSERSALNDNPGGSA